MLRLMTLNLWGYEQWDNRKDAVLSLINRQSPDVIALQEVQLDMKKSPVSQASYRRFVPSDIRDGDLYREATLMDLPCYQNILLLQASSIYSLKVLTLMSHAQHYLLA